MYGYKCPTSFGERLARGAHLTSLAIDREQAFDKALRAMREAGVKGVEIVRRVRSRKKD